MGFLFIQEPERNRDLGCVEKLGREADDAVNQICLNDVFADVAFTAGLRRE